MWGEMKKLVAFMFFYYRNTSWNTVKLKLTASQPK